MNNLKRIRENAGISQNKLAQIAGVSPRMIPKYETGEKDINAAAALTVYKIATALNVDVHDILEIDK